MGRSDAIVTTALVPGRPAPKLIPASAVEAMKPGSVIVDLAGEAGGNCELARPGETYTTGGGVIVAAPLNVPSQMADVDIVWKGVSAGLMRPDSAPIQRGLDAFEQVLGVRPLLVRSGGTLPIMPALADKGIATVLTGFGLPESNVHSPNEKFLVRYFDQGVETAAALYTAFKELPTT